MQCYFLVIIFIFVECFSGIIGYNAVCKHEMSIARITLAGRMLQYPMLMLACTYSKV